MGRTSKVVTNAVLVLALAAITVPAAVNVVPALLPKGAAVVAATPTAQLAPTRFSGISGVSPLSASAPLPNDAVLIDALDSALKFDGEGDFSANVTDVASGKVLYSRNGTGERTPASNLKMLTAAAALQSLGPDTRFSTSVVAGPMKNSLILKAGGDSLLTAAESKPEAIMGHAGLATLAEQTAAALKAAGITGPVTLGVDDTLFTGPALNPKWLDGDIDAGEIAPIYPMALYGGRSNPDLSAGPRPQDSAIYVAQHFATALERAGVKTSGGIGRASAPASQDAKPGTPGAVLASVSSATVAQQVQYFLDESDNYVSEVLARMVAIKESRNGSSSDALEAVQAVVASLGIDMDGIVMVDICGLAPGNLISADQLVKVVTLMLADPESAIAQALPGFPIAGLTGTLGKRFTRAETLPGAGVVRAKTGTLNEVATLTGYVINSQGRLLAFSFMGNKLKGGPGPALPVLDAAATVLAKS